LARRSSKRICTTSKNGIRQRPKPSAAASKAVGGGAMYALAPGRGILAHHEANNVLHTYVALNRSEEWIADIDFGDAPAANARVAAEFDGWAPQLTALITDGDAPPVPRGIYALPDGHSWDRVIGVTLLGDAEVALTAYEDALFPRSESASADAHRIQQLLLGDRAPFGLVDLLTGAVELGH
jgi:hypothetical protein